MKYPRFGVYYFRNSNKEFGSFRTYYLFPFYKLHSYNTNLRVVNM